MSSRNREYIEFLKQRFNEEKYINFISDLLNLSEGNINNSIKECYVDQKQFKDTVCYYKYVAKYASGSDNIGAFIVKLTEQGSQAARTSQRTFISGLLNRYSLDAAIVAFYQDGESSWRLSFVKKELSFTDKGMKIDLTPAKRYSYLVGENESVHTAQEYLLSLLNIENREVSISDIEKVFDVEKVTKKFFEEYKDKYLELKEFLDNNEDFITESKRFDFTSEEFAKKLMGQIVFLYFLQKKGWLGVQLVPEELSEKEYKDISDNIDSVSNNLLQKYYKKDGTTFKIDRTRLRDESIKENINNFLAIFKNTEYEKNWGTGDRKFIRNLFNKSKMDHKDNFFDEYLEPFFYTGLNEPRDEQYFPLLNCKIPFLNGGLFEPLNNYRWSSAQFNIPDKMFSNEDKNGILDIFDLYNFTIDEEEPLEKDIAVDPEMLGKIFENLLDVDNRKSTGSFYTPREIVHYMCQESLAEYLVNKLDINYDEIINFIKYGDVITQSDWDNMYNGDKIHILPDSLWDNIIDIDNALKNVKIADPAVGSGAFPLGMLNEIVKLRDFITSYIEIKRDRGILSEEEYNSLIENRSIFEMKLQSIQNSIYAVDYEPSAVDIAKLRLWLSLIVDYDNEMTPKPLPNLDCKIIQGNSLVDKFEGVSLFNENLFNRFINKKTPVYKQQDIFGYTDTVNIQQKIVFDGEEDPNYLIDAMLELQKKFFLTSNSKEKKALKEKINKIQYDMIKESLNGDLNKIKKFDIEYKKRKKGWMIWNLEFYDIFKYNSGFDIVIGNPPYLGEDGNKKIFEPIKKSTLGKRFYMGKMDLLYFFFHLALDLVNKKGIVAMITTNYFITADGALKLREDLKERSYIKNIINFNEYKVFETAKGQHNMITILTKDKILKNSKCKVVSFENKGSLFSNDSRVDLYDINHKDATVSYVDNKNLYYGKYNYLDIRKNYSKDSTDYKIINYLKQCEKKLSDLAYVYQGVATGANKVKKTDLERLDKNLDILSSDGIFVLDLDNLRDKSFYSILNEKEKKLLRPYYKSTDIGKYSFAKNTSKRLLYIDRSINDESIIDLPNIINHLKKFLPMLMDRRETKEGKVPFYQLQWPRDEKIFKSEKILVPYRSKENAFAYCDEDWFFSTDCYCITSKGEEDLKYILALMNSKPYYIWYKNMGKIKGDVLEFMPTTLNETPIIDMLEKDKKRVVELSKTLSTMKNISRDCPEMLEIDAIIMSYIEKQI